MKPLTELSHYEVLEVGADAARDELERAWRMARSTYVEGSLGVYSVFGDSEVSAIRQRIDEAWRVLSDPDARRAYDAARAAGNGAELPELPMEISLDFEPEVPAPAPELEALEEDADAPFDGARLRRTRLHCGLEIEQIASVTKINPTYLRFIEEERFDDLPAPVYVRGFVAAYARCVGLDADRAAGSYMERFQASRAGDPPRGRRRR